MHIHTHTRTQTRVHADAHVRVVEVFEVQNNTTTDYY